MPSLFRKLKCSVVHVVLLVAILGGTLKAANSTPIGSIHEIKSLGERAQEHLPVRITGVVTALSGWKNSFFLQDKSDAISVDRIDQVPMVKPGTRVEVSGMTAPGLFAPIVIASQTHVLGNSSLPSAPMLNLREILTGQQDARRIALRGVIRSAEVKAVWGRQILLLQLDVGTGEVAVHVLNVPTKFDQLIDAEVEIEGVCGSVFNGAAQIIGVRLFVPDISSIAILTPSPDPFHLPAHEIGSLLRFGKTIALEHRVRVHGILTYQDPGKELYLQDGDRGLAVWSSQRLVIPPGTQVDAVGFLGTDSFAPTLSDAIYRPQEQRSLPKPIAVDAQRFLTDHNGFKKAPFSGLLITTKGELIERVTTGDLQTFVWRAGNTIFSGRLANGAGSANHRAAISPGSLVAITGICTVETDRAGNPMAIRLLLRSASDIQVLQEPTWWNAVHTRWVLGGTSLMVIFVVCGNLILHRRVQRQVALLTETRTNYQRVIETANDAFIEIDETDHILEWNGSAEKIFGWKRAEVLGKSLVEIIIPVHLRSAHCAGLGRLVQTTQPEIMDQPVEMTAITRQGAPLHVELTIWAVEAAPNGRFNAFIRDVSKRREAEERLKKSEAFQRQILESSPDCIKVLDLDGRLLSMNAGGCRAMEIDDLSPFISRYWPELWPMDSQALAASAVDAARQREQPSFCGFCPTAKGTPKWWDVRITLISSPSGVPERLLAISRDVTAQKVAEAAASEARRQLDLALRAAQIGSWTWDIGSNRLVWHEDCAILFGLDRKACATTFNSFLGFIHPDDRPHLEQELRHALESGHFKAEYRIIWPDRSEHVLAAQGEVLYAGTVPTEMVGICWDITQRKQAEQALQDSETQLKEAQRIAHLGRWSFDLATQTVSWSDEVFQMFGLLTDHGITYERYLAMLPCEDRQQLLAAIDHAINTGKTYHLTHGVLHPDGSMHYVDVRGRVARDHEGCITGLVGTALDVTERVRASLALEQSRTELENRVNERTAALRSEVKQREVSALQLREAEGRLAVALEFSGVAAWTWTPSQDLVIWSGPVREIFGRSTAELASFAAFREMLHTDDSEDLIAKIRACVDAGSDYEAEFRILMPGGEERWIAGRGRSIHQDGVVLQMSGVNYDITQSKRAEQKLLESERYFRHLADAMPQIVWTARADGTLDYYNERWYTFTGFNRGLIGDESLKTIVHPEDLERSLVVWDASVQSGEPYEIEYRFWDGKSRTFRWHLGRALPVRDADGKIVRWFGTCTDIDDYKRATAELKQLNQDLEQRVQERSAELLLSEQRHRLMIEGISDYSIFMLDRNGLVSSWNAGAERISQYTVAEIMGQHFSVFHSEELIAVRHPEYELEIVRREGKYQEEAWRVRKDGSRFWANVLITAIKDADGSVTGFSKIVRDLTEQKEAEQHLITAQQHAEEANRTKSDFLASMSHEIRTPMNAILGMADLLWETELDRTQRNYVQVFRRAGSNLLTLVNDILDLSKIESGHFELESIEFDLEDLIERTAEIIRPKTQAKHLELMVRIAPGTPSMLVGDPTRLQQVLFNLLGNATKFTQEGHIALVVGPDPNGPGRVRFAISDTGIGIPADQQQRIFDDFIQAESSTTRRFGGTGLGLGICQRLVERMGGKLSVTSEVGKGSTFSFDAQVGLSDQEKVPDTKPGMNLVGRTVLVVDDNPTNRLIFTEMCSSWGMLPLACDSASAAVTELQEVARKQRPFDLAIVDRVLPDMDGFAWIAQVRETHPTLPIILTSSDDVPGDATRAKRLGAAAYATKPVRRSELLRLVCQTLGDVVERDPSLIEKSISAAQTDISNKFPRILIAEDSEDNRFVIQAYLKDSRYQLTFVENGEEALHRLKVETFDLVFMDMQMPVMDGLCATRLIRKWEQSAGARPSVIIALTANARREDVEQCTSSGCTAHLSKPISKPKLVSTIEQYLQKRSPALQPLTIDLPAGLEQAAIRYIQSRRTEVEGMTQLLEEGDFQRLRVLAHNMKGTGLPYGFPDLTEIGAELETAAKREDPGIIREQISRLATYVDKAVAIVTLDK